MMKKQMLLIAISTLVITAAACAQATASPANPAQTTQAPPSQAAVINKPAGTSQTEPVKNDQTPTSSGSASPAGNSAVVKAVKVAEILNNPKVYQGETVRVEGRIASECPSGCWFTLKDGNAVIYIDLAPNNMVIPQKKGSFARVTAEVVYVGSDVYLVGSKVEF